MWQGVWSFKSNHDEFMLGNISMNSNFLSLCSDGMARISGTLHERPRYGHYFCCRWSGPRLRAPSGPRLIRAKFSPHSPEPWYICNIGSDIIGTDNGLSPILWQATIMMTSSNGRKFPRHRPFVRGIHRSSVKSPHKGQWRLALMFYLICARINSWVNNRDAGDLNVIAPIMSSV